jgi:hypothetical protein
VLPVSCQAKPLGSVMGLPPTASLTLGLLPPNVCSRGAITLWSEVCAMVGAEPRAARTWGKPALRGIGTNRTERASLAG